jgi:hypothetical protein
MTVDKKALHAVRVLAKAANADALAPQIVEQGPPAHKAG